MYYGCGTNKIVKQILIRFVYMDEIMVTLTLFNAILPPRYFFFSFVEQRRDRRKQKIVNVQVDKVERFM